MSGSRGIPTLLCNSSSGPTICQQWGVQCYRACTKIRGRRWGVSIEGKGYYVMYV